MPREYIENNNGIDLTSERQARIDEILKDIELTIDQRGHSTLLAAEFLPDAPRLPERIFVHVNPMQDKTFIIVSTEEIPLHTYGKLHFTRRDGSSETTSFGYIISARSTYRKEDANKPRFISVFEHH